MTRAPRRSRTPGPGRCASAVVLAASLLLQAGVDAQMDDTSQGVSENPQHVARWNRFADALLSVHQHRADRKRLDVRESIGGYGDSVAGPGFYREAEYRDAANGRLLSRIRWETAAPERAHVIEVFVYDDEGRTLRDYVAAFLPGYRNAPIQTLLTFHDYNGALHAFRTFDASGNRLYERCEGEHLGDAVKISLTEEFLPFSPADHPGADWSDLYVACFGFLPLLPGRYLDPSVEIPAKGPRPVASGAALTDDEAARRIARWTEAIAAAPTRAQPYVERARAYFDRHAFAEAVLDLDRALAIEPSADAYFWRGMALGRDGRLPAAIRDLDVFLTMRPQSSLGYTKRGIRHFWAGDETRAEHDFRRAIVLDPDNAEAHDDLGVITARRGDHRAAITLFHAAIRQEPGYFKAHHNLAVSLHLGGDPQRARISVERALDLSPNDRDSLLLHAEILERLGEGEAARRVRDRAEFLPEGGWSERSALQ